MVEPGSRFCRSSGHHGSDRRNDQIPHQAGFEGAKEELEFFDNFVSPGKIEQLRKLLDSKIHVCEYEDAVKIIQKADHDFEHKISFGDDLATEHENT